MTNFGWIRSCGTVALMVLGQFSDICGPYIRKLAKNHKSYGSAASESVALLLFLGCNTQCDTHVYVSTLLGTTRPIPFLHLREQRIHPTFADWCLCLTFFISALASWLDFHTGLRIHRSRDDFIDDTEGIYRSRDDIIDDTGGQGCGVKHHFQQYFIYIVACQFYWWRKP